MINLDHIERVARAAQEKLEQGFDNRWSWFRDIGPDVVLALVARVRELEQGVKDALDEWQWAVDADFGIHDSFRSPIAERLGIEWTGRPLDES